MCIIIIYLFLFIYNYYYSLLLVSQLTNVSVHVHLYWAVQEGLLTPLTFARRRFIPLAAFTSGAYFLHNGRRRH